MNVSNPADTHLPAATEEEHWSFDSRCFIHLWHSDQVQENINKKYPFNDLWKYSTANSPGTPGNLTEDLLFWLLTRYQLQ